MWFHEQYAPGTTAYTMAVPLRLRGALDLDVLQRALQSLVGRHESLRMRFPATAGGEPTVDVSEQPRVPFVRVDLAADGSAPTARAAAPTADGAALPDPADRARQALERELARPLDIAAGPPLRVVLVRLAEDDHVLGVLVHHIVFDGWSAEILTRELAELYRAFLAGRPSPLPPLPIGYGDFAAWQRQAVQRGGAGDAEYWAERLAGVPPLQLPTDRPYPDRQRFTGGWYRCWLDPGLTAAVADLARAHQATPFMTLLAAFQALLGWYCGQSDFAVGSPVSGRDRAETEPLVGLFLNTVAIRADVTGDPRFAELVGRVRGEAVRAYAHQGMPFERVVAQLRLPRDTRRNPVFQVLFDLQGWPRPDPHDRPADIGGGVSVTRFEAHNPATRHELALHLAPVGDRLEGYLTYNTDLFDPATVERLCQRYLTILRQVTADPGRRLSELDLLEGPERAQVLAWGDGGPVDLGRMPATLGGVLDGAVAATPDAPAVIQDGQALTFRDLDRRANRLARHLRQLGVAPDTRVGICLPPSLDQAVAVLAVLRAGGAYLPLDPEQPPARLAFLLAGAGAAVVVTDSALARRLPGYAGRVVAVDRDAEAIGAAGADPLPVTVAPENLAYVIFTSGSTGVPKGVAVAHGPVLRYLAAARRRLGLGAGGRFGLLQPLAYDFSVTMFYLSLLTGGCLHLVPRRVTGEQLASYLAREGIDYLKLTPSHLAALASEVEVRRLLPRRALVLGGEACGAEWARQLAAASDVAVFNHYGPTEASVGVTVYRVPAEGRVTAGTTPIGRPLPGAGAYVLDRAMRPVPVGAVGELYLGGDRLARGYLGQPKLTAPAFVADPYGPAGARLYRTGDLARWLPDGNLEFRGRRDHQVKVRGYRVEPAEVEAALAACPEVAQSVVVAREDRLVAYLERVAGASELSVSEVRGRLAGTLPEHLLPSRVVWLDRLPLLPHGKVDRRSLPEPAADRPDQAVGYVAPAGPVETAIAQVWADALGLDRVGAMDDFFDLGGHSLLATRVASRLRQVLPAPAHPVTVLDLFTHPTVRRLAGHATSAADRPATLLHELTPPGPAHQSLVCVPYGGASAVVYQPLAAALPPGYALYAVTLPGHDIGAAEELPDGPQPVAELAARCVAEIRDRVAGPLVLYGHCGPGGALAVEIARQLEAGGRPPQALLLGGIFPFSRPTGLLGRLGRAFRLDRLRSDTRHATWLQALGANLGNLDPAERRFLIRVMRRDTEAAEEYFGKLLHSQVEPLAAPVVSVVGERDPATEFYQERYREWGFLSSTTALVVLDEAGHYFLKYRAGELAAILTHVPPAVAVGEPLPPSERPAADPPGVGSDTWRLQAVSSPRLASDADETPLRPARAATVSSLRLASVAEVARAEPARRVVRPSMARFLAVAASQLISATGSALTEFAFPIWAFLDTGSLLRFTLFAVAGLLPGMLVLPLAGAIVDRTSRRRVMLVSSVVAGSVQLTLAALVLLDRLPVGPLYGLLALLSVALAFQRLAFTSAVPQLVPKMYLGHANGVVQLTTSTASFLVPLLAVGLLSTIGLAGILAIDVATYLVAVGVLLLVRFPAAMPRRRRETMSAEIREGLRYLWWRPGLRAMLLFFVAINVFLAAVLVLISPLVLSVGTLGNAGLVASVASLGGVAGGLVMALWGGPRHYRMRGVLWSTVAFALAAAMVGARPSLPLIATGAFGIWFAMAIQGGIWFTIVMVKVPHRIHGRVLALNFMVAQSVVTLGFLLAPLASDALEPLLQPGGALAGSVGSLIGVGPGRGIALVYLVCAAAISTISLAALRWTILARFDSTVSDAEPDDIVGLTTLSQRRPSPADARSTDRPSTPDLAAAYLGSGTAGRPGRAAAGRQGFEQALDVGGGGPGGPCRVDQAP